MSCAHPYRPGLKEGQIRYCESLDFSQQELCKLTRLTADGILFLSNSAVRFIITHIDHDMQGRMLARMGQERLFQLRLEEALSPGTSIEFINSHIDFSTSKV
ncbi:MAG: STY4526/YPO1902 family pathogenicity island replication protein [Pseudescherichia vulneris]|nr:STY4526/YPO1902 family pathogenicity island replication protein [Pseudescherichia vulneris]